MRKLEDLMIMALEIKKEKKEKETEMTPLISSTKPIQTTQPAN